MRSARRIASRLLLAAGLVLALAAVTPAHELDPPPDEPPAGGAQLSHVHCEDGFAGVFPCRNVDLRALLPLSVFATSSLSDVWGWADPVTGFEYALVGTFEGTAFVDVTDPDDPVLVGTLPSHTFGSAWRDIRTHADHAFIVSEAPGHGMQVFDLTRLRAVGSVPVTFTEDAHFAGFGDAHNVSIDEASGRAYAVGADACNRGLVILDVSVPSAPSQLGCFSADGYTHDVQCVVYHGPDAAHQGRQICFASNVDTLTIVDVTNPAAPVMLSRSGYPGVGYVHQGWLTDDHAHFFQDDETDERDFGHPTRTYLWDVSDLDAPVLQGFHPHATGAIDHNLFVRGSHLYQAHYRAGLRIHRFARLDTPALSEVAFLDTDPASDAASFSGVWGVYPYLPSGIVLATDIYGGLFVVEPDLSAVGACEDGLDNDGDGKIDWDGSPPDPQCGGPGGRESAACGLGAEPALLLALLAAARGRRPRRHRPHG